MRIVQKVAHNLAAKFKFGYHGVDDLEQQGVLFGLEALESGRYDPGRPLENFLSRHIRNRLSNYRRDNYMRLEPPCQCCDTFNPPAFPCQKWRDWSRRNLSKRNVMQPLDMTNLCDESEKNMRSAPGDLHGGELQDIIDRELPLELRRDYLQMLEGKTVPKLRREKVRQEVAAIMERFNYATETEAEC